MTVPTITDTLPSDVRAALASDLLRGDLHDALVTPDHPEYDQLRAVWNGMIERRPASIARPRTAREVASVVRAARTVGLPIAVRGGGHNVAGLATDDDALVIDLRAIRDVAIDTFERVARVGGGARWADVDAATARFGLVTPGGAVSDTGVAGLTLSGGLGWARRRLGLACDQLVGAELVLADGSVLEVDDERHPDLMWALRGGGGNVGIVTRFDFRLHAMRHTVDVAFAFYPLASAERVVDALVALEPTLPPGVAPLLVFGRSTAAGPLPAAFAGTGYLAVAAVDTDEDAAAGATAIAALRRLDAPNTTLLADLSTRMPYAEAQAMLDADYPAGGRYYWSSASLARFDAAAVAAVRRCVETMPEGHSTIDVWLLGGALAAVPASATAYAQRAVPWLLNVEANWHHAADDERHVAWARATVAELAPWQSGGTYLNFPGLLEGGQDQVRRALGANLERLASIKARVDPDNVFRRNANVAPARPPRGLR